MRKELITHVAPGATFSYLAPRMKWDLAYTLDYRYYSRNSQNSDIAHTAQATGSITLLQRLLFLDLSNRYQRVPLDISRDTTLESLTFNQSDQNQAQVSPYILLDLGGRTSLKTGYRYSDTRYWNSAGIDKLDQSGFLEVNRQQTERLSLSAGYTYVNSTATVNSFDRHDLSAGFRYEYADKSFLYGQVGNSWQSYDSGNDMSNLFWNAGITRDFTVAVATVESSEQYTEDPLTAATRQRTYLGKLDIPLQRGAIGLSSSYSEYVIAATGRMDRRRLAFDGSWRYELIDRLTASLAGTVERVNQRTTADYPYRLSGTAGVNYLFNHGISMAVNYTYVIYRFGLDDASGSKEINRAIVEVRKSF